MNNTLNSDEIKYLKQQTTSTNKLQQIVFLEHNSNQPVSYLALARKWRPGIFTDVIGQDHVVSALTNALTTQRVHHAFLFTGTRGVGKTTLARIFAKALNCETGITAEPCGVCNACTSIDQGSFIDLLEVDAASRTKVDDTRELLDNVQYTPTLGRYKIYLIDEVHMLSTHSFNALLKTLEEPPAHVKFLLATTDPQKLPSTILSRCIQFNLKSVEITQLVQQLEKILAAESIEYETQALSILARSANGSVRDSLSLLDQAIAFSNSQITAEKVRQMLGMIDDYLVDTLLMQIASSDCVEALNVVGEMATKSADFSSALDELLTLIHNVSLYQVSPAALDWKNQDTQPLESFASELDAETLQLLYQIGLMGKKDFDYAPDPRSGFEMIIIRMISFKPSTGSTTKAPLNQQSSAPSTVTSKPKESVRERLSTENSSMATSDYESDIEVDSTNVTSLPIVSQGKISIDELATGIGWQRFVESSGMVGLSRQLLMNMVPKSIKGREIAVSLAESSRHLFNDQRRTKIEQYCKDSMDLDVSFKVDIEDLSNNTVESQTPAQRIETQQQKELSDATKAFTEDENVQHLIDSFDAEIVPESIQTRSSKS